MSESEPLYGESEGQGSKYLEYGIGAIVAIFSLVTVIVTIAMGISRLKVHILFGVFVLCLFAIWALTVYWYRQVEQKESIVNYFIIYFTVVVLFSSVVALVYTTAKLPVNPSLDCNTGGGFYMYNNATCFTIINYGDCLVPKKGYYVRMTGLDPKRPLAECKNWTKG